ncbi:MAG: hypothetical protein ACFBWO_18280 [Paracoccaceae bacterium]
MSEDGKRRGWISIELAVMLRMVAIMLIGFLATAFFWFISTTMFGWFSPLFVNAIPLVCCLYFFVGDILSRRNWANKPRYRGRG